ncbi:chaperone modulator CbpM [Galbibacter pacificus]|uniref:Chaperone modulator CbpM n=1 Tax=Galbibacter pacificus TaxID=2996052 RepID=A0ABT6FW85_9FLAO|nr:chaperone modulator CbpM [Galbibacter pacificus]MDG3584042.1 chaperone modulator CbpM [Galbibacter pacificus]MDG3587522.1 chaperone modulator CbpM [Galbibacter pacificus]
MASKYIISISEFCNNYGVDEVFVMHFTEAKLIHLKKEGEKQFIQEDELPKLEKMVRLYHDLGINLEGLETIAHLLDRIDEMNKELQSLKNRLRLYE